MYSTSYSQNESMKLHFQGSNDLKDSYALHKNSLCAQNIPTLYEMELWKDFINKRTVTNEMHS